jgi:putative PEP-CTERM system histidine kinase
MNIVSYFAAGISLLLAGVVAVKDRRSFANRSFIALLILLEVTEVFRGAGWHETQLLFFAPAPGTALLFSLSLARSDYRKYLDRWKYVIMLSYALPIATLLLPIPFFKEPVDRIIPLGYAGKIFYVLVLISAVLILANLERTLRASTGRIRWQIKFIVLGMGAICASWIYSASQALVYSALDTSLDIIRSAALLAACVLSFWGLLRSQFLRVDVYLSHTTIQYSFTALLASVYLLVLGLMAYQVRFFNRERPLPLDALVVLIALGGLGMLLLSDRIQERVKRVVIRHFKRPVYDYRKSWMELTENTNSLVGTQELCTAVAKIISRTLNILSVNIWLCDEAGTRLSLSGSTVFARSQAADLERNGKLVAELLPALRDRTSLIDLLEKPCDWAEDIMRDKAEYFADFKMRYILPLQSGGQLVGIITLNNDRVGKSPLSLEDQDLLHAYAAQLAARVLQLRLSEDLRKAQEIEAFQNVSAFFVHDLKNIASRLSLTMQNLPAYFENPAFREDALKLIGESVSKIDATCSRLSSLKQKIELKPEPADLNEIVAQILDDFQRCNPTVLERDLQKVPVAQIDKEQFQKVLTNLLLNAREATNGNGIIRVSTSVSDRHISCKVSDNGCGMSRQFLEQSLFRPFRSTKKKGMGIGLFQSNMIVQAHKGRIEVESEKGTGTTFRVVLPL